MAVTTVYSVPDDGCKGRPKHVELFTPTKEHKKIASLWHLYDQITLVWACTENRRKQNSQKNLGTTTMRGRSRNRWQDEVKEDGRIDGVEGWQEKVHNREEWKKLLRMARNRHILHMPME